MKTILLFLVACGPASQVGVGLPHGLEERGPELDGGVMVLAAELKKAGLHSDAVEVMRKARPMLNVKAEPFMCSGVVTEGGCSSWGLAASITLVFDGVQCFNETAFLHEVTHLVLCAEQNGDCDHGHKRMDAWEAVNAANHAWTCQGENTNE
jgi:hypothetical protein